MTQAITLDGLTVRHGDLVAVDELSFEVAAGEVLALLGPNGAGKTTTVETLEGYRRADAGSVRVLGLDPTADRRRLVPDIGVMLQQGGVYPVMSPVQALRLFSGYYPNPIPPKELLSRLGLEDVASTPWRRLSGGEQQRVSLALALIGRPKVLFLDEPTAGVDLHGRAAIREVITEQRGLGTAILLTTHELAEAEAVADRVAILHRGKLARIGTIEELTGGGVRFRAPAELDLTDLSASLGVVVSTEGDGRYRIDAEASPQLVADLGTWLAGRGATLGELRSGASLEDAYVEVVGDLAHQISEEAPASRRRGRRNR